MKFLVLLCVYLLAAAPATLFVAGRDNGPIAFALLEKCQQYFKCTVLKQHLKQPATADNTFVCCNPVLCLQDSDIAIGAFQAQQEASSPSPKSYHTKTPNSSKVTSS